MSPTILSKLSFMVQIELSLIYHHVQESPTGKDWNYFQIASNINGKFVSDDLGNFELIIVVGIPIP